MPAATGDPGQEIERKFVVENPPDDLLRFPAEQIAQGYLTAPDDSVEVRVRRKGDRTLLTVKRGRGRVRAEEEIEIDADGFERLWPLTEGARVEKVRYAIPTADGHTIELDVYTGALHGLVTAEVEFGADQEASAFEPPAWLGAEVTDDPRYGNRRLAADGAPR